MSFHIVIKLSEKQKISDNPSRGHSKELGGRATAVLPRSVEATLLRPLRRCEASV